MFESVRKGQKWVENGVKQAMTAIIFLETVKF